MSSIRIKDSGDNAVLEFTTDSNNKGSITYSKDGFLIGPNLSIAPISMSELSTSRINLEPSTLVGDLPIGSIIYDIDEACLSYGITNGSIQVGKETFDYYTNISGVTLVEGDVVSATSVSGNRVAVTLTDPNNYTSAMSCIGVVTDAAAANQKVRITKIGDVHELNTDAFTEGLPLYVDPLNPGKLTQVLPLAPISVVSVGCVLCKHQNQGVISVNIRVVPRLRDLADVNGGILDTSGQMPIWDSSREVFDFISCWDDLRAPATGINPIGSPSPATPNATDGSLSFAKGNVCIAWFQVPHAWRVGSDMSIHIHWSKNTTNTGTVHWQMKYKWFNIGDVDPGFSVLLDGTEGVPNNNIANRHSLFEWPDISGNGKTISSMICVFLQRTNDAGDTFTGTPNLYEIDIHYQIDSLGSIQEFTK